MFHHVATNQRPEPSPGNARRDGGDLADACSSAPQPVVGSTHFALLALVREFRAAPARTGLAAAGCGHPLSRLFRLVVVMERHARRPWGLLEWDGRDGPFAACAAEVGLVNTLSDCQRGDADAAASRLAVLLTPAGRAPALAAAEDTARALARAGVRVDPLGP